MGAGASAVPDSLTLEQAKELLPDLFDQLKRDDGTISTATFISAMFANKTRCDKLFDVWDADQSGYLEVKEFNVVLALYNGVNWDILSEDERKAEAENFLKYYDVSGKSDGKIDKKEFVEWIDKEVTSFSARGGCAFDTVTTKLTELVMVDKVFKVLDVNGSGFLEVGEFNSLISMYNGFNYGKMATEGRAKDVRCLKVYDNNGVADKKLDKKEFSAWLMDVVHSFTDASFDSVAAKLLELATLQRKMFNKAKDNSMYQ